MMSDAQLEQAVSQELTLEQLMTYKAANKRKEVDRCDKINKLLLKLSTHEMTEDERKTFSLSFVGPNQRKLGAALASLRFWEDEEAVKLWIASKR